MVTEENLRRMFADGERRWPGIRIDFESFCRHCYSALGSDPPPLVQAHGADLYLCCACVARNPTAILAFQAETSGMARAAISHIRRNPEFVEEALQHLYDKLLLSSNPKVAAYAARGPLKAWTRVIAARLAIDESRARRLAWGRRVDLSEELNAEGPAPDSNLTRAEYAEAFQRALECAVRGLSAQNRNLLRMQVVGKCTIDQIGRIHGVHRATAARWLERVRLQVLDSMRQQLCREQKRMTESEFMSIARSMGSVLELSLSVDSSQGSAWCGLSSGPGP
jgi:RNA polymerase sigma-70 factor, ECF subfamily